MANATFHDFFAHLKCFQNDRKYRMEREGERKSEECAKCGQGTAHLWQEAALEFSQLCVKTRQAIFVARMIYVRPFVARTNLCHNRINKCATGAAVALLERAATLQISLCGHLRRHVQRIYSAFA